MGATKQNLDFTNVKEGGNFSKKHMPAGDYLAKVTKVEDAMPKDTSDKTPMWLFTIQLVHTPSATYPYYCKLQENQLWKVRNLLVAAGINVPKKKVAVDPSKLVGKVVAVSLDDTEYQDKMQSEIGAIFSPNELDGNAADDVDDVDDDDDEEEEAPRTKKSKKAAAPEPDEDEDEDDEDDEPLYSDDRDGLKAYIKAKGLEVAVKKSMSDDDIRAAITAALASDDDDEEEEDEDEEPEPPKSKKKKKAKPADDEDDDEIDIEDLD